MRIAVVLCAVLICFGFTFHCSAQDSAKEEKVFPQKVEVDSNYDGSIDRIEHYDENGQLVRIEADTTGDGAINEWITYTDGKPTESKRDSNGDGKPDVWMKY
ncbi:MAG: hypothetical protein A2Z72_02390 [Omnitrophica bacterium RBG_13_46_9]|nr:MAG: hypothetical protein A2Z72_02390 [Omnitrophica bacterium RBG_13_46_9]